MLADNNCDSMTMFGGTTRRRSSHVSIGHRSRRESNDSIILDSCSWGSMLGDDDDNDDNNIKNNDGDNNNNNKNSSSKVKKRSGQPKTLLSSIYRPPESRSSANTMDDFTVDKLRYDSLGIYGRDTEIAILNQALDSMIIATNNGTTLPIERYNHSSSNINIASDGSTFNSHQLVLISGEFGVGKSKLAHQLKSRVKAMNGIFCYGKFDQFSEEPYHGVASACRGLCTELCNLRESDATKHLFGDIHDKILEKVKNELPLLFTILPELRGLLCSASCEEDVKCISYRDPDQNLENLKNRMHFALLRFFGVISGYIKPLVMVWDDIHFADTNSLNLLELILTDSRLSNLMIIACYRSNEIGDGHSVTEMLRAIDEKETFDNFQVSKISIGNLEENHSHQIIMSLLGMDDVSCTAELASICHRKTAGNPFFLVSFMTLLYQQKMIEFNLGLMEWIWNLTEIKDNTLATSNVVDLIQRKLESLSSSQRSLLIYASFLGPVFSKNTIGLIWDELGNDADKDDLDLNSLLESSVKDGIFEITYNQNYRFVHDKVRECANSLIKSDQIPLMRHRIGRTLLVRPR